jgi:hypothetical protein
MTHNNNNPNFTNFHKPIKLHARKATLEPILIPNLYKYHPPPLNEIISSSTQQYFTKFTNSSLELKGSSFKILVWGSWGFRRGFSSSSRSSETRLKLQFRWVLRLVS